MSVSLALRRLLHCVALWTLLSLLCRVTAATSATTGSTSLPLSDSDPSPLPAPFMADRVFHVGLVAKSPSHPLYGIGDPDCFAIDGVAGGNISVVTGGSYAFQAMNLAVDYALYISTDAVGAGAGQLSPYVFGDATLLWTVALPSTAQLRSVSSRSTDTAARFNSSTNSSVSVQFVTPFGSMRVSGRLQSEQMPANETARRQVQGGSSTVAQLRVDALPLSDTRAADSGVQQAAGRANTTFNSSMSEQQPVAELYLQALLRPQVGVPIYVFSS